jgi:hypothetical protein
MFHSGANPAAAVFGASTGAMITRGATAHFTVAYDTSLGANGPALADGLLATCEHDYDRTQAFFPKLIKNPFLIQIGTPISQADAANFVFAAYNGSSDLFCLKRTSTGTGRLEVHLLRSGTFQSFNLHTGTAITQADAPNFDFTIGAGSDLYCLKRHNTGTGRLEMHILTSSSNYQTFRVQTGTPITESHAANFVFAVEGGSGDLFCFKRTNTGTGKLEVHILTASSNYQQFRFEKGTPITQADAANFDFAVGNSNVYCIKRTGTATGKLEVHILDGGNDYQSFRLQTSTPITQADAANFSFAVGDGSSDLYCLKRTNTGTGRLEVHILKAGDNYLGGLHFTVNIVPGTTGGVHSGCSDTTLNIDAINGNDADVVRMLVIAESDECFMDGMRNGWDCGSSAGEGLSRVIAAELYPGSQNIVVGGQNRTFGPAPVWLNGSRPNWVDKTEGTDRNSTSSGCATLFLNYLHYQLGFSWQSITGAGGGTLADIHAALTGIHKNAFLPFATLLQQFFPAGITVSLPNDNPFPLSAFALRAVTPIAQADATNFDFAAGDFNRDGIADLYCIKRTNTDSGMVEVDILDGASNYQGFVLRMPTPITQADAANFLFALGDFNGDGIPDLYCVKRSNTGTGKLEVHVLNGATNYQTFLVQTGTPITQADASNFSIAASPSSADLYCLKRHNTGTGRLEVHVLRGGNNFQSFALQTGTPIIQSDTANFVFAVADYDNDGTPDLYCLKRTNTGTGSLEVHILRRSSNFQNFLLEKPTPIPQGKAAQFQYAVGDFNRDGMPDVFCMEHTSTASGQLEIQVLNGGANY